MDALTPQQFASSVAGTPAAEAVAHLEAHLAQLPQVDLQTQHIVHAGVSARTIFIPAGTTLTGALTRIGNVCIVVGDITVTTDEGPQRLTGHHVITAQPGAKRAGYAHADTWWTTVHHTEQVDVRAIEAEMTTEADRLQTRTLQLEGGH